MSSAVALQTVTGKAPRVVSLRRFGFHAQPTVLVLTFDRPLDPTSAQDPRNYLITNLLSPAIGVRSVAYDPFAKTVTLHPAQRLNVHRTYRLIVNGTGSTGVRSADGVALDGAGTGRPGSDFSMTIDRSTLFAPTLRASHPRGPSHRS